MREIIQIPSQSDMDKSCSVDARSIAARFGSLRALLESLHRAQYISDPSSSIDHHVAKYRDIV
jgi:hypothetical protein